MSYQVIGFSAISLQFESAVGGANLNTPGTFGAFSGTVSLGVNPSTSVACATVANCTAVFTGTVGWYRVNFISHTGSGTITGTLKGYISGVPLGGQTPPSGTACPGTVAAPCVVMGPDAQTFPVGHPPVLAGSVGFNNNNISNIVDDDSANGNEGILVTGQDVPGRAPGEFVISPGVFDGTNIRRTAGDASGNSKIVGAAAAGAAVAGNPVLSGWSDGTNAQNAFFCTKQTIITISAGTDAVIAAGTAAKKTIVCHIDFVSSAAQTFTLQEGTGVTCGTGTAAVSGAYPNTITFAADYGAVGSLRTATAADDLCLHAGGAVTVGGLITYAQF